MDFLFAGLLLFGAILLPVFLALLFVLFLAAVLPERFAFVGFHLAVIDIDLLVLGLGDDIVLLRLPVFFDADLLGVAFFQGADQVFFLPGVAELFDRVLG